jgi:hypothetical protein
MFLKKFALALLAVGALAALVPAARATPIIYVTSVAGPGTVDAVDIGTNSVKTVIPVTNGGDSLVFAPNGDIIYDDESNGGQVRRFNRGTMTSTPLATGLAGGVADLTLEPSRTSVLASGAGVIYRVFLSGGFTPLAGSTTFGARGLAYDSAGRLWANVNDNAIDQLDPTTGAILHSYATVGGDGLTFDSFTGKLYFSQVSANPGSIYSFDPNNPGAGATALPNSGISIPDGLTSDGMGNLYIASFGDGYIYQYNFGTQMLTQHTFVAGLDDLAPLSGLGSPTPEPSTLILMGGVSLGLVGYGCYRRKRAA